MAMSKFFEGYNWKRVAIIGASGGLFYAASDYWVDKWWDDETDTKKRDRYRAVAQMALGVGVGYVLRRWNKDAALGVAVGGIVGGARRLWISEGMPDRMSRWFDDTSANGVGAGATPRAINAPERVVFSEPRRRARVAN